mmetsp:Transcript_638/g.1239  ORF Transcript_638/g.1239 Transcript_638/m.1239 type:complete len:412 (-) Transcript_638:609-1844(-)
MLDGNSDKQGCMRYCTSRRMGRIPSAMSRSNKDVVSPALAAFLHMMTGPSWHWSPTITSCFAPKTMGIRASASTACVASSMSTCRKRRFCSRGSPAPTHVQQMTSAACKISFSAFMRSVRNLFSSAACSSPNSAFSSCSFRRFSHPDPAVAASSLTMRCRLKWSVSVLVIPSRLLATMRTTFKPERWIFAQSWSTATLLGAHTNTCPTSCLAKWNTRLAEVTVFPVPGGPWIKDRGRCSTSFTAENWLWFSSGRPGTERCVGKSTRNVCGSTSCPSSSWYRYPDTLVSSTANCLSAFCMRSKLTAFHTSSTMYPSAQSKGGGWPDRISRTNSPSSAMRTMVPWPCHSPPRSLAVGGSSLSSSSSPMLSRKSSAVWLPLPPKRNTAIFFLFSPTSHRTLTPSWASASLDFLS